MWSRLERSRPRRTKFVELYFVFVPGVKSSEPVFTQLTFSMLTGSHSVEGEAYTCARNGSVGGRGHGFAVS